MEFLGGDKTNAILHHHLSAQDNVKNQREINPSNKLSETGNAYRNFIHILVPKPNHLAIESINEEKFPDTILSKIMGKTK